MSFLKQYKIIEELDNKLGARKRDRDFLKRKVTETVKQNEKSIYQLFRTLTDELDLDQTDYGQFALETKRNND